MGIIELTAKNTFLNLPEDKRARIVAVAVCEFAANGYQKASLNSMVKDLGIAKGSLYQYFAHKEALFLYVFECFTRLVRQTVKDVVAESGELDFFGQARQVVRAGTRFIDTWPDYFQIYQKVIFEQDIPRRDLLLSQVRLFSVEYFAPLCVAAQKSGLVRRDVPVNLIIFMVDAVIERFLQAYAKAGLNDETEPVGKSKKELAGEIDTVIDLLRDGIGRGLPPFSCSSI
ncbi:MAG: TetR/AcrR family transcriptional regulator [Proteobacteria bacterium]|nr:TetR/AcrR family transcriptional regulator [Pseudomonadota bacterium]MBU1714111.1 TetR/AcrR family transcriptional regulator [Pseudomonadota bacterium]